MPVRSIVSVNKTFMRYLSGTPQKIRPNVSRGASLHRRAWPRVHTKRASKKVTGHRPMTTDHDSKGNVILTDLRPILGGVGVARIVIWRGLGSRRGPCGWGHARP